jgi:hypothetical protein
MRLKNFGGKLESEFFHQQVNVLVHFESVQVVGVTL